MIFVDYPGHLVAVLVLAGLAVLMVLAYLAKQSQKARKWKPLLGVLQVVEKDSMSRLDKALAVFVEKFRPSDPESPDYKIYGFDARSYYSDSPEHLHRWGQQTNLHSALAVLDGFEMTQTDDEFSRVKTVEAGSYKVDGPGISKQSAVVGAIIFTDGQADDKNIDSYVPHRGNNLKVVLVGVGSKGPQTDVAVESISSPWQIAVDTAYPVRVVVTAKNLQNQPVTLELLKDGCVIGTRDIPFEKFASEASEQFMVGADLLGRHVLSARAKIPSEEVNTANNIRSTVVRVVENAKLKVLLYTQVADLNIGKVREALARDKKIQLDLDFDAIKNPALSKKAGTMCGHVELPTEAAGFYKYDVIILGPCAVDKLTDTQVNGLYSFVVDRGGGLIILPGRAEYGAAGWKDEKAKALLPVSFGDYRQRIYPHPKGRIKLTLEGLSSKIISNKDIKNNDEVVSLYYANVRKKPAATTLASVRDRPIIAVHRIGRGRVCLLNVSRLLTWYREDQEGGLLQKLLSGLTAYVGQVTTLEAGVELFAERVPQEAGKVKFDAYIKDNRFRPVSDATVLLSVNDDVLRMDQAGPGHYVAEAPDVAYESVIASVQAESDGVFLGEKTVAVDLPPVRSEMSNVEKDAVFLKALAKRLGGEYFDSDDIDKDVTRMFKAKTRISSLARMTSVWPRWSLLLALSVVLGVTWFIRRAVGLV